MNQRDQMIKVKTQTTRKKRRLRKKSQKRSIKRRRGMTHLVKKKSKVRRRKREMIAVMKGDIRQVNLQRRQPKRVYLFLK